VALIFIGRFFVLNGWHLKLLQPMLLKMLKKTFEVVKPGISKAVHKDFNQVFKNFHV
jgi:hypothetical protein